MDPVDGLQGVVSKQPGLGTLVAKPTGLLGVGEEGSVPCN